jgi:flavin reductase ActVB
VSAFCSVSLEPPLVLVCIEKTTGSHDAISDTEFFVVNILAAGQDDVSERFSFTGVDKFEGMRMQAGVGGVPILEDALGSLECRLWNAYDGGDHTIFVGSVERMSLRDGYPLVYFHSAYHDLLEP